MMRAAKPGKKLGRLWLQQLLISSLTGKARDMRQWLEYTPSLRPVDATGPGQASCQPVCTATPEVYCQWAWMLPCAPMLRQRHEAEMAEVEGG